MIDMRTISRRMRRAGAVLGLVALLCVPAPAMGAVARPAPSRATVLQVQRLFRQLGYPLGSLPLGGFGVRTRGAISYFQHKYGLPVTGYPDTRTLAAMRGVAASLHGASSAPPAPPHDAIERTLGNGLPVLTIAVALAAVLALLALSSRGGPDQDSASAEETLPAASADGRGAR
jgi:peptidoglycan hydrolase-like protein with peptidoglycan-binding domain